jgi:hypothetical protein
VLSHIVVVVMELALGRLVKGASVMRAGLVMSAMSNKSVQIPLAQGMGSVALAHVSVILGSLAPLVKFLILQHA